MDSKPEQLVREAALSFDKASETYSKLIEYANKDLENLTNADIEQALKTISRHSSQNWISFLHGFYSSKISTSLLAPNAFGYRAVAGHLAIEWLDLYCTQGAPSSISITVREDVTPILNRLHGPSRGPSWLDYYTVAENILGSSSLALYSLCANGLNLHVLAAISILIHTQSSLNIRKEPPQSRKYPSNNSKPDHGLRCRLSESSPESMLCRLPFRFLSQGEKSRFTLLLRLLRKALEIRWSEKSEPISSTIITSFALFEEQLMLERPSSTDARWNVDYQEQRTEVLETRDLGYSFWLKCRCKGGEDGGETVHESFCPRIQPPEKKNDGKEQKAKRKEERKKKKEEKKERRKELKLLKTKEETLAKINDMVGLAEVKIQVRKVMDKFETSKLQSVDMKKERFGTMISGNSGSGRKTFARHYAKLLASIDVVATDKVVEVSGAKIANRGISGVDGKIGELSDGGVILVQNSDFLLSDNHRDGERVLDHIMEQIETLAGKIVFLFVGSTRGIQKLRGHSDGAFANSMPYLFECADFTDDELRSLLNLNIKEKFGDKMKVEDGPDGLYMRIAAARLGRARGSSSFCNAKTVQNLFARIWERQSTRLVTLRKEQAQETEDYIGLPRLFEREEIKCSPEKGVPEKVSTEKSLCEENLTEIKSQENVDEAEPSIPASDSESNSEDTPYSGVQTPASSVPSLEPSAKPKEDHYFFTKEDIIGPDPAEAIAKSEAWTKLQNLTGLKTIKEAIGNLAELVKSNYKRELEEKPVVGISLQHVFLGSPGTGKTTVAKLYAQILAEIGLLSKGDVYFKTPSDLIGPYIGWSERNTKEALASAVGGVLVIDEAYMLYASGKEGSGSKSDSFRQAVIDTIVSEVDGSPGSDRCVILVGYTNPMTEMLQNSNPGLSRRFPLTSAFHFDDFSNGELELILNSKLKENVLGATESAVKVALGVLEKRKKALNFGNAGEVDNLISQAKSRYQNRMAEILSSTSEPNWIFEPKDFDPEFDREESATTNLRKLFSDVVGFEQIIRRLETYQKANLAMKLRGLKPQGFIPTTFVFKGPPGTGKTTTARKMAQVYYDMGFLAEPEVIDCSASDLVGKYVGHSGPKTRKVFERALGKVLFIDEAYRLSPECKENSFTSEVVSEIVDLLTKPQFMGNLIVIIAGYTKDINRLLNSNSGLASRFSEEIVFKPLEPAASLRLLQMKLAESGVSFPIIQRPLSVAYKDLLKSFRLLATTPSWGNARDARDHEMKWRPYQPHHKYPTLLITSLPRSLPKVNEFQEFMATTTFKLNTGAEVPALGFGTWQSDPGEVQKAVSYALSVGYKHIDCAYCYGNEDEVGAGLKEAFDSGNHDKFPKHPDGSRDLVLSWSHLQTWAAMEKLLATGKVKSIGVANYSLRYLEQLLPHAKVVPAVNQIENHPSLPQQEIVDFCKEKGIHVMAYSPLGSSGSPMLSAKPVIEVAEKRGVKPGTVLLSYHLARGNSVLAKSVHPEWIKANMEIIELDEEDMKILTNYSKDLEKKGKLVRYVYPPFGVDFGFPDKL
ncbi:hypothetical protein B7494_g4359 [Chlorociboria aeruginascens]|nr:hypothetical protein B7494_g4359 [Chlorociboria aeruginascens]